MANFNEIDPLLALELSGVKTYSSQEEAWAARLYEWLNTPVGEVYGNPSWGNILPEFKHEPTNLPYIQIEIELRLMDKLVIDLPDVPVRGLSVKEGEAMDMLKIAIQIHSTVITQEVRI